MTGAAGANHSPSRRLVSYVDDLTWLFLVPVDDSGLRSDDGEPAHLLIARATWDAAKEARAWDLYAVVGGPDVGTGNPEAGRTDEAPTATDAIDAPDTADAPDTQRAPLPEAVADIVMALDARQVLSPAAAVLVTSLSGALVPKLVEGPDAPRVRTVALFVGLDPAAPTQAGVAPPFRGAEPTHIQPLLAHLHALVDGAATRPPSPAPLAALPGADGTPAAGASEGRRPWTVVRRLQERIAEAVDTRRQLGQAVYDLNATHQEIELARQNVQARLRDQEAELHRVERDAARLDAERAHHERARAEARQARLEADHEERELAVQEARLDRRAADLDEQEARLAARLDAIRHEQRQVAAATTVLSKAQRELARADTGLDGEPSGTAATSAGPSDGGAGPSDEGDLSVEAARSKAAEVKTQLEQQAEKEPADDGGSRNGA